MLGFFIYAFIKPLSFQFMLKVQSWLCIINLKKSVSIIYPPCVQNKLKILRVLCNENVSGRCLYQTTI